MAKVKEAFGQAFEQQLNEEMEYQISQLDTIQDNVVKIFNRDYRMIRVNGTCPQCKNSVQEMWADPSIKRTAFECDECVKHTIFEDLITD